MTILSAIKDYLATCPELNAEAPIWTNYVGANPTEYSVSELGGSKVLEQYIHGGSLRQFNFAFNSTESTADELARAETGDFFEAFSDWLDAQTEAGVLPDLGPKKTAIEIRATGWGFLLEQGESGTGIYQIQCSLVYEQQP